MAKKKVRLGKGKNKNINSHYDELAMRNQSSVGRSSAEVLLIFFFEELAANTTKLKIKITKKLCELAKTRRNGIYRTKYNL